VFEDLDRLVGDEYNQIPGWLEQPSIHRINLGGQRGYQQLLLINFTKASWHSALYIKTLSASP